MTTPQERAELVRVLKDEAQYASHPRARDVMMQAAALIDADAGEAVHWRAVLDPSQRAQQLKESLHFVGFRRLRAAESWVAEQNDFYGWRYTIEPLYTRPQQAAQVPLTDCGKMLHELTVDAARVIRAWDTTVLPKSNDGMMFEAVEDLRSTIKSHGIGKDQG